MFAASRYLYELCQEVKAQISLCEKDYNSKVERLKYVETLLEVSSVTSSIHSTGMVSSVWTSYHSSGTLILSRP